jgi:hypothetical protein
VYKVAMGSTEAVAGRHGLNDWINMDSITRKLVV